MDILFLFIFFIIKNNDKGRIFWNRFLTWMSRCTRYFRFFENNWELLSKSVQDEMCIMIYRNSWFISLKKLILMPIRISPKAQEKIQKIIGGGKDNLLVLSDFDKTLTKWWVDGKVGKSLISFLRDGEYLDPKYNDEAKQLFEKYYPMEIDPTLDEKKKFQAMNDWWTEHFALLVRYWLTREVLDKVISENRVVFADGIQNFFDVLNKKKIPFVIISAGIEYLIHGFLEKYRLKYVNVFTVANTFDFSSDGTGKIVGVKNIIHGMNKSVLESKNFPFYSQIQGRKNAIILGDSPSDIGMANGWAYDVVLKIGFCHHPEEQEKLFKEIFDIVVFDDEGLGAVVELLKKTEKV